jgi:glucokinase
MKPQPVNGKNDPMPNRQIGIDIGGTGMKAGIVENGRLLQKIEEKVLANGSAEEVVEQVKGLILRLGLDDITGIGIGIPGLVNPVTGVVYDVMNIPAWTELDLKGLLEKELGKPVALNNDANCFAAAAFTLRQLRERTSLLGITIGTGMGTGIIWEGKLISGLHGGAGEFGLIEYRDQNIEYYASGRFFENVYGLNGLEVYQKAMQGDQRSLDLYAELGFHFGNAVKTLLYALDINYIILGGSVSAAWPLFREATLQQVGDFAYHQARESLVIETVQEMDAGIIGAAALVTL